MSKKKIDSSIIRLGDYVRIIKPDMFVRCGYPMSKKQAKLDVDRLFGSKIEDLIYSVSNGDEFINRNSDDLYPNENFSGTKFREDKCYKEILSALAYVRLTYNGFGGNKRSVHIESKPDLMNKKATAIGIKFVQSGYYNAGYSGFSYDGEWDGSPAYLSNNKTHKILKLDFFYNDEFMTDENRDGQLVMFTEDSDFEWIESVNVKKISAEEYKSKDKIINPTDRLEVL